MRDEKDIEREREREQEGREGRRSGQVEVRVQSLKAGFEGV